MSYTVKQVELKAKQVQSSVQKVINMDNYVVKMSHLPNIRGRWCVDRRHIVGGFVPLPKATHVPRVYSQVPPSRFTETTFEARLGVPAQKRPDLHL